MSMAHIETEEIKREIIEQFKNYFTQLKSKNEVILDQIYSDEVVFTDPIHTINGLENLKSYFEKLNQNLIEGSFKFTDESIIKNKVYLHWEMDLQLKKPKKRITAMGISVLTLDHKIIMHRDYFDAGEVFYENIPLLGGIIKFLKKKIAN